MDPLSPLTLGSSRGLRPSRSGAGLLDGVWIDEEGQVSAGPADAFFASLADRTPAQG
jgi:hypothetical protein